MGIYKTLMFRKLLLCRIKDFPFFLFKCVSLKIILQINFFYRDTEAASDHVNIYKAGFSNFQILPVS